MTLPFMKGGGRWQANAAAPVPWKSRVFSMRNDPSGFRNSLRIGFSASGPLELKAHAGGRVDH